MSVLVNVSYRCSYMSLVRRPDDKTSPLLRKLIEKSGRVLYAACHSGDAKAVNWALKLFQWLVGL